MATKDIAEYSLPELEELIKKRKEDEITSVNDKLKHARNIVSELEAQLEHLTGVTSKPKRGRKPGSKVAKAPKVKAVKRGKRGALGEGILKFLQGKGKEGAHVTAIATHIGSKPANVTAYFYGTGKKVKGVKALGKNVFSYTPSK